MSPAKNRTIAKSKTGPAKKTPASNSKTKSVTSKQGLKKKLNEFGDEDAL